MTRKKRKRKSAREIAKFYALVLKDLTGYVIMDVLESVIKDSILTDRRERRKAKP